MKLPRFLKEYACFKIKEWEKLKKNFPENAIAYDDYIKSINNCVRAFSRGLITIDECMKCIANR